MASKPRDYIVGIVIFTIVVLAGISMINRAVSVDSTFIEDQDTYEQFQSNFNKSSTLQAQINELETSMSQGDNPTILTVINLFFLKAFNVLMSLFGSFAFMESTISTAANIFSWLIPNWLPALIISIITIMFVFSIVSAILQRDI